MRRITLPALCALLLVAALAYGQEDTVEPVEGNWICDYSEDGGPIIEMTIADGEFTLNITTPDNYMTWAGTYEFADNKITFTLESGSGEGVYDPEADTISAEYEGVEYVFSRVEEEY
jgi:hypothetical protein